MSRSRKAKAKSKGSEKGKSSKHKEAKLTSSYQQSGNEAIKDGISAACKAIQEKPSANELDTSLARLVSLSLSLAVRECVLPLGCLERAWLAPMGQCFGLQPNSEGLQPTKSLECGGLKGVTALCSAHPQCQDPSTQVAEMLTRTPGALPFWVNTTKPDARLSKHSQ